MYVGIMYKRTCVCVALCKVCTRVCRFMSISAVCTLCFKDGAACNLGPTLYIGTRSITQLGRLHSVHSHKPNALSYPRRNLFSGVMTTCRTGVTHVGSAYDECIWGIRGQAAVYTCIYLYMLRRAYLIFSHANYSPPAFA